MSRASLFSLGNSTLFAFEIRFTVYETPCLAISTSDSIPIRIV